MRSEREIDWIVEQTRAPLEKKITELTKALERVLLDIDFMVERNVIPDIRGDIIYVAARKALGKDEPAR